MHCMQISALSEELKSNEKQVAKKRAEMDKIEKSLEALRVDDLSMQDQLSDRTKAQDKLLNKRMMVLDTIQAKQRLIRDLGTVPKKEVDESKSLPDKDLLKKLRVRKTHLDSDKVALSHTYYDVL
jgi:chromosome segregation ATPase